MTLLIRLTVTGVFITAILFGASLLPPFPREFGETITIMFQKILMLDTWFPVRLTIDLFIWIAIIDAIVYSWNFIKWAKSFLLGEART